MSLLWTHIYQTPLLYYLMFRKSDIQHLQVNYNYIYSNHYLIVKYTLTPLRSVQIQKEIKHLRTFAPIATAHL